MFEYDALLGWKFISSCKGKIIYPGEIMNTIETNSLGFRDHAHSSNRQKRLLVLGDSFVSNLSVKDNEVFTEIMEDQLKDYDVLNFGVNGYGQVQEYLLLKKWFDEINPDLIVLLIYLQNDFTDNLGNYWLYSRPSASLDGEDSIVTIHPQSINQPQGSKNSWNILSKSHLYRLIARVVVEQRLFSQSDPLYVPQELYSCQWPISKDYHLKYRIMEKLLLKIAEFAKDRNVPVVFALAPSIIQIDDEVWASFLKEYDSNEAAYARSLPNDRLMQFAKKTTYQ